MILKITHIVFIITIFIIDTTECLTAGGTWKQIGADINGEAPEDNFGHSVTMSSDGSTIAVGAQNNDGNGENSGHVRVYALGTSFNIWGQVGSDINGKTEFDQSGVSLDMSGDGRTIAVGAISNQAKTIKPGHVAVYTFDATSIRWEQIGDDIVGEAAFDAFGSAISMSIDGKTIAIGARTNDGNGANSGHVCVYSLDATSNSWVKVGLDIDGEAAGDRFGSAVVISADGKILAIGAPFNNGNGASSGHVRVFSYNPTSKLWGQVGSDINGKAESDRLGSAIAMSGDGKTIAVGAPGNDDDGEESGHVRVYSYISSSNNWEQLGDDINGEAVADNFGFSVAMSADGRTIAIGTPSHNVNGQVRVYSFDVRSNIWEQIGEDINGKAKFDNFGAAIAMSEDGSIVAIGADRNDDNGDLSGHVRAYKYESPPIIDTECDEVCGIFGLNIFCPLTFCGVMGRFLFNICDC